MTTTLSLALLFISSLTAQAEPRGVVDAEIKDVKTFTTETCDCRNPEYLGKICIASTKWQLPIGPMYQDTPPLTNFEAHVVNEIFILTSTAFYMRCNYGPTPIVFTDPDLQAQFAERKFFDFEGVKGIDPWMKLAMVNSQGITLPYMESVKGAFSNVPFYSNQGESIEHYRMEYPGVVKFEKPLIKLLGDFTIRRILDGEDVYRNMKAVLMNQTGPEKFIGFGEYTIRIRFFKKPGTVPNGLWDMSVIGMEVVK